MPTVGDVSIDTEDFLRVWGAPTYSHAVASDRFDQFEDLVPDLLSTFWREFGFSGFGNGLFWLCDPVAWQPAVDAWTRDLELEMGTDRWLAVCRSAFGRMQLWGRRTGMSLTITPYRGRVSQGLCLLPHWEVRCGRTVSRSSTRRFTCGC